MCRFSICLCGAVALAFSLTTVYQVELSSNDHVIVQQAAQEFIAIADSIGPTVTFFCGRKTLPGYYVIRIMDSVGNQLPGNPTANSDSAGLFEYCYVPATFNQKVGVIKGAKYRLVVKHSLSSCTTDFYYDTTNAYIYGKLLNQSDTMLDLAARVEGVIS